MKLIRALILPFVLLIVAACAPGDQPMRLDVDADRLVVLAADGSEKASFEVEIADNGNERAAGLMHRTDLPRGRAMLFVFDSDEERYFWMKNTPAALDIIYGSANGEIVHIAKNTVPFSTQPIPSYEPARYALEVLAGVTDEHGLIVGDKLSHRVIVAK